MGFLLFPALFFGYQAKIDVAIQNKELIITIAYDITNDQIKIIVPARARLISLASPPFANIQFYKNDNIYQISDVKKKYNGKITLKYGLVITAQDFIIQDWLPVLNEPGEISANLVSPVGYKYLVIPYQQQTSGGFSFSAMDNPILICGKFTYQQKSSAGINYELYSTSAIPIPIERISDYYNAYQTLLGALPQKNLILIQSASLNNLVSIVKNNIFVVLNNAMTDEIRRALAGIWFKGLLKWSDDYCFAFTDLYQRLIDDEGKVQADHAMIVPVPGYKFYEKAIKSGFDSSKEMACNVDFMLKNFALLHLAYYTIGLDNFTKGVNAVVSQKGSVKSLMTYFTNMKSTNTAAVSYVFNQLLPFANSVPDFAVNQSTVIRNNDLLPNTQVKISNSVYPVEWGGQRNIQLTGIYGDIQIDPLRAIPQMNFYNDYAYQNPVINAEIARVYQQIVQHKHFAQETFRELLALERFIAPAGNVWGVPQGTPVYVGVVKFFAPYKGWLKVGLKEIFVAAYTENAVVLYDRIRIY
jgi:hypothetical protein